MSDEKSIAVVAGLPVPKELTVSSSPMFFSSMGEVTAYIMRRYADDLTQAMANRKAAATDEEKAEAARTYGLVSRCKIEYLSGKSATFIKVPIVS